MSYSTQFPLHPTWRHPTAILHRWKPIQFPKWLLVMCVWLVVRLLLLMSAGNFALNYIFVPLLRFFFIPISLLYVYRELLEKWLLRYLFPSVNASYVSWGDIRGIISRRNNPASTTTIHMDKLLWSLEHHHMRCLDCTSSREGGNEEGRNTDERYESRISKIISRLSPTFALIVDIVTTLASSKRRKTHQPSFLLNICIEGVHVLSSMQKQCSTGGSSIRPLSLLLRIDTLKFKIPMAIQWIETQRKWALNIEPLLLLPLHHYQGIQTNVSVPPHTPSNALLCIAQGVHCHAHMYESIIPLSLHHGHFQNQALHMHMMPEKEVCGLGIVAEEVSLKFSESLQNKHNEKNDQNATNTPRTVRTQHITLLSIHETFMTTFFTRILRQQGSSSLVTNLIGFEIKNSLLGLLSPSTVTRAPSITTTTTTATTTTTTTATVLQLDVENFRVQVHSTILDIHMSSPHMCSTLEALPEQVENIPSSSSSSRVPVSSSSRIQTTLSSPFKAHFQPLHPISSSVYRHYHYGHHHHHRHHRTQYNGQEFIPNQQQQQQQQSPAHKHHLAHMDESSFLHGSKTKYKAASGGDGGGGGGRSASHHSSPTSVIESQPRCSELVTEEELILTAVMNVSSMLPTASAAADTFTAPSLSLASIAMKEITSTSLRVYVDDPGTSFLSSLMVDEDKLEGEKEVDTKDDGKKTDHQQDHDSSSLRPPHHDHHSLAMYASSCKVVWEEGKSADATSSPDREAKVKETTSQSSSSSSSTYISTTSTTLPHISLENPKYLWTPGTRSAIDAVVRRMTGTQQELIAFLGEFWSSFYPTASSSVASSPPPTRKPIQVTATNLSSLVLDRESGRWLVLHASSAHRTTTGSKSTSNSNNNKIANYRAQDTPSTPLSSSSENVGHTNFRLQRLSVLCSTLPKHGYYYYSPMLNASSDPQPGFMQVDDDIVASFLCAAAVHSSSSLSSSTTTTTTTIDGTTELIDTNKNIVIASEKVVDGDTTTRNGNSSNSDSSSSKTKSTSNISKTLHRMFHQAAAAESEVIRVFFSTTSASFAALSQPPSPSSSSFFFSSFEWTTNNIKAPLQHILLPTNISWTTITPYTNSPHFTTTTTSTTIPSMITEHDIHSQLLDFRLTPNQFFTLGLVSRRVCMVTPNSTSSTINNQNSIRIDRCVNREASSTSQEGKYNDVAIPNLLAQHFYQQKNCQPQQFAESSNAAATPTSNIDVIVSGFGTSGVRFQFQVNVIKWALLMHPPYSHLLLGPSSSSGSSVFCTAFAEGFKLDQRLTPRIVPCPFSNAKLEGNSGQTSYSSSSSSSSSTILPAAANKVSASVSITALRVLRGKNTPSTAHEGSNIDPKKKVTTTTTVPLDSNATPLPSTIEETAVLRTSSIPSHYHHRGMNIFESLHDDTGAGVSSSSSSSSSSSTTTALRRISSSPSLLVDATKESTIHTTFAYSSLPSAALSPSSTARNLTSPKALFSALRRGRINSRIGWQDRGTTPSSLSTSSSTSSSSSSNASPDAASTSTHGVQYDTTVALVPPLLPLPRSFCAVDSPEDVMLSTCSLPTKSTLHSSSLHTPPSQPPPPLIVLSAEILPPIWMYQSLSDPEISTLLASSSIIIKRRVHVYESIKLSFAPTSTSTTSTTSTSSSLPPPPTTLIINQATSSEQQSNNKNMNIASMQSLRSSRLLFRKRNRDLESHLFQHTGMTTIKQDEKKSLNDDDDDDNNHNNGTPPPLLSPLQSHSSTTTPSSPPPPSHHHLVPPTEMRVVLNIQKHELEFLKEYFLPPSRSSSSSSSSSSFSQGKTQKKPTNENAQRQQQIRQQHKIDNSSKVHALQQHSNTLVFRESRDSQLKQTEESFPPPKPVSSTQSVAAAAAAAAAETETETEKMKQYEEGQSPTRTKQPANAILTAKATAVAAASAIAKSATARAVASATSSVAASGRVLLAKHLPTVSRGVRNVTSTTFPARLRSAVESLVQQDSGIAQQHSSLVSAGRIVALPIHASTESQREGGGTVVVSEPSYESMISTPVDITSHPHHHLTKVMSGAKEEGQEEGEQTRPKGTCNVECKNECCGTETLIEGEGEYDDEGEVKLEGRGDNEDENSGEDEDDEGEGDDEVDQDSYQRESPRTNYSPTYVDDEDDEEEEEDFIVQECIASILADEPEILQLPFEESVPSSLERDEDMINATSASTPSTTVSPKHQKHSFLHLAGGAGGKVAMQLFKGTTRLLHHLHKSKRFVQSKDNSTSQNNNAVVGGRTEENTPSTTTTMTTTTPFSASSSTSTSSSSTSSRNDRFIVLHEAFQSPLPRLNIFQQVSIQTSIPLCIYASGFGIRVTALHITLKPFDIVTNEMSGDEPDSGVRTTNINNDDAEEAKEQAHRLEKWSASHVLGWDTIANRMRRHVRHQLLPALLKSFLLLPISTSSSSSSSSSSTRRFASALARAAATTTTSTHSINILRSLKQARHKHLRRKDNGKDGNGRLKDNEVNKEGDDACPDESSIRC